MIRGPYNTNHAPARKKILELCADEVLTGRQLRELLPKLTSKQVGQRLQELRLRGELYYYPEIGWSTHGTPPSPTKPKVPPIITRWVGGNPFESAGA